MILNPFEIKAEILSIIEDCCDETDPLVLNSRVSRLDEQKDTQTIERVLFKELLHANTSKESIIRFLLQRYISKEHLIEELWSVLRNNMTSSEVKIIVLSYLRELETDWKYEDFSSAVGDDIDIIDNDTKTLLNKAIVNPEVQIDFLDFLSSVDEKDKLLLVKSLGDDYSEDALANILIPVFLSAPETAIGKEALNLLGTTKSQLAYHALLSVYDFVSDELKPSVKKNINLLKLSGIRNDNTQEFYKELLSESIPYRCCATYPDGQGNQSLIFSRKNIKTNKVQFVAVVVNDYTGVRDCFGFNEISQFECDKIIERFYKDEINVEISPVELKTLLMRGEYISRTRTSNWLLPYEYTCWKNIMADVPYENFVFKDLLSSEFDVINISDSDLECIENMDFLNHWFLDNHYSSEFEAFIEILDTEVMCANFDMDELIEEYTPKVFYSDEYEVWKNRLLVCSYMYYSSNELKSAGLLYNLYLDQDSFKKFLIFILKKSVYEYYFSLKFNTEENQNKFTMAQLDNIISMIEEKWVRHV